MIVNRKPVIPHDEDSPKVIQLESAMGAAIGTVAGAGAIEVGRDRFFPVKTTNDLFAVRSDLYRLNDASVLEATVEKTPPIDLDPKHYKMMGPFDALVKGVPSLRECTRLKVRDAGKLGRGPVVFTDDDRLSGKVMPAVPEGVRRGPHIKPGLFPVAGHQLLDGADREWAVAPVLKQRGGRRGGETPRGVEGEELGMHCWATALRGTRRPREFLQMVAGRLRYRRGTPWSARQNIRCRAYKSGPWSSSPSGCDPR